MKMKVDFRSIHLTMQKTQLQPQGGWGVSGNAFTTKMANWVALYITISYIRISFGCAKDSTTKLRQILIFFKYLIKKVNFEKSHENICVSFNLDGYMCKQKQ